MLCLTRQITTKRTCHIRNFDGSCASDVGACAHRPATLTKTSTGRNVPYQLATVIDHIIQWTKHKQLEETWLYPVIAAIALLVLCFYC